MFGQSSTMEVASSKGSKSCLSDMQNQTLLKLGIEKDGLGEQVENVQTVGIIFKIYM
jgi:hypothetical protein